MFKNDPISFLWRHIWTYSVGTHGRVIVYCVLSAVATVIWTLQPMVIGKLLNTLQTSGGITDANVLTICWLIFGLIAVNFFYWACHGPSRIIEQENAHHVLQQYRSHIMRGILNLPIAWHSDRDSGNVLDRVTKATSSTLSFAAHTFQNIGFVTQMVVTAVILGYYSISIALITLGLIFLSFFITYQFDLRIVDFLSALQLKENKLSAKITDTLTNMFTVKILHIEKPVYAGIMHESVSDKPVWQSFIRVQEWKWFTGGMIFNIISIVPLLVYVWIVRTTGDVFEVGTFTALYLYSSNLIYVYYGFNSNYEEMLRYRSRIRAVADIEDAIAANEKHPRHVVGEWQTLTLRGVSFGYDTTHAGDHTLHLDTVGIAFKKGERVALIGSSGSGKTTFLKVLHGMYASAVGEYSIDAGRMYRTTNFADIDLESTLVPQEPEVFSSTIRENITLAQDFSDADVAHAMDVARFTDVLPSLPNGLDSVVNEKGVNLSGGQKQRLALARALLFSQNKSLLLLDESTSSVDPDNEVKIYEKIFEWWKGYTVIATIHKLNLLKYFDRIIIFDKGKIVDDGTFDQLLARNAPFRIQWAEYVKSHQSDV
jgi:ATP-binding cassette, subfamily B, bacterial